MFIYKYPYISVTIDHLYTLLKLGRFIQQLAAKSKEILDENFEIVFHELYPLLLIFLNLFQNRSILKIKLGEIFIHSFDL